MMVKKGILLLSAICFFATSQLKAQHVCATDEMHDYYKQQHPEIAQYEAQLEKEIRAAISGMNINQFAKTTDINDDTVMHIPIVFHVVHDYGNEYVSDNEIYACLADLNRVFSKKNPDTIDVIPTFAGNIPGTNVPYIGNARIQFHLAQKDPNGNPTKGITRTRSYLTNSASDQSKLEGWPQQSYMNVWIINRFHFTHSSAAAYAVFPATAETTPQYDGIISQASYINSDHTIPHEMGHILNLRHVWGNGQVAQSCGGDDLVDDTPPTKGHDITRCTPAALYDVSCSIGYEKFYDSGTAKKLFGITVDSGKQLYINYPDTNNSQNIMDYTYCAKMFTYLQTVRMREALKASTGFRSNLMNYSNHYLTGIKDAAGNIKPLADLAPVADFSTVGAYSGISFEQNVFKCANSFFTFNDRSWNDTVTSYNWKFTDGANAQFTSTNKDPLISFANPGWVKVELTATSNAGSGTIVRDSAVFIPASTATPAPGYYQEFNTTSGNDLDQYPIFNHYKNDHKWTVINHAGYYDNTSICMNVFDARMIGSPENNFNSPVGDVDEFYTPAFDLSSYASEQYCNLSFMISGATTSISIGNINDTLEISYLSNCNNEWQQLAILTKNDLQPLKGILTPYTPTNSADWEARSIDIPVTARTSKVFFRFRYKIGGAIDNAGFYGTGVLHRGTGNNVYIDRIHFNDYPTQVKDINFDKKGFALAPNPTTGGTSIIIDGTHKNVTVNVLDITGKLVYTTHAKGDNQIEIPADRISVKGIYLVQIDMDGQRHTDKLIVQ